MISVTLKDIHTLDLSRLFAGETKSFGQTMMTGYVNGVYTVVSYNMNDNALFVAVSDYDWDQDVMVSESVRDALISMIDGTDYRLSMDREHQGGMYGFTRTKFTFWATGDLEKKLEAGRVMHYLDEAKYNIQCVENRLPGVEGLDVWVDECIRSINGLRDMIKKLSEGEL